MWVWVKYLSHRAEDEMLSNKTEQSLLEDAAISEGTGEFFSHRTALCREQDSVATPAREELGC